MGNVLYNTATEGAGMGGGYYRAVILEGGKMIGRS